MPKQRECILIQTVTKTHDFDRVLKQLIILFYKTSGEQQDYK
jgi:hypothetical protein